MIISLFHLVAYYRDFSRREQRRQAAANGDSRLPAIEQPNSNLRMLPLPFTIQLHRYFRWRPLVRLSPGIFIATGFFALALSRFQLASLLDITRLVIAESIAALFILFFFLGSSRQRYTKFIVTNGGITLEQRSFWMAKRLKTTRLAWDEIRLFAIVSNSTSPPRDSPLK
jgi:hypothetical protein